MTSYRYAWGNNPRRAELQGRRCVIEASGEFRTVLLRFLDTGERVTSSRRALRDPQPSWQTDPWTGTPHPTSDDILLFAEKGRALREAEA